MTLNLPEYVTLPAVSWIRRNHATMRGPAGCGGGYYKSLGSCEMCGKHTKYGRPGPGYIYRETGEPVGVINYFRRTKTLTHFPRDSFEIISKV